MAADMISVARSLPVLEAPEVVIIARDIVEGRVRARRARVTSSSADRH